MKNKLKPLHFISTILLSLTIALFLIPLTGINTYAATPSKTTNTAALNSFQLNHDVVTIAPGQTITLSAKQTSDETLIKNIKWGTYYSNIAVNSSGKVTGKRNGFSLVYADAPGYKRAYCVVLVEAPVQAIRFNEASVSLNIGETYRLNPVFSPSNAVKKTLTYSSDNPSAVTVDKKGNILAVGIGTANITASSKNYRKASISVTVKDNKPVTSISLQSSVTIGKGETTMLNPVILPADASDKTLYTSVSTPGIISLSDFNVTGINNGTTSVALSSSNGINASCNIIVKDAPESIKFNNSNFSLGIGESYQLKTTIPANSASKITYSSSNTSVCTVTENGKILGVSSGTSVISAETFNGKRASFTITVKPAPETMTLNMSEVTLGFGETVRLITHVDSAHASWQRKFVSSDNNIASVDAYGNIRTKATGTAIITAYAFNNVSASCTVTIKNAPSSVSINPKQVTLKKGSSDKISYILPTDSASYKMSFSSTDTSVCTVDQNGTVKAVSTGTADIIVSTFNGKTAKCSVSVTVKDNKPVTSISLQSSVTIGKGETTMLNPVILPADASDKTLYTSVSTPGIISLSDFNVTGINNGTTSVALSSSNGINASCNIIVKDAPESIKFNNSNFSLGIGESYQLKTTIPANSASKITYSSSNTSVCTVTENGKILGVSSGTSVISAETFNGKRASFTITVKPAPETMTLNMSEVTLGFGETVRLITHVDSAHASWQRKFVSSDNNIASVDAYGNIRTKATGTAIITAYAFNNVSASCTVTIKNAPSSVSINPKQVTLKKGSSDKISYILPTDSASYKMSFSSTDTSVCTVDQNGTVKAVSTGTADIIVSTFNGKTAKCSVTVSGGSLMKTIKPICQHPELPTGCEITALTTVLNYYGYNVTKEEISDYYLEKGNAWETDFHEKFAGDPRSVYSYGCYSPVIVETANKYLKEKNSSLRATELKNVEFEKLFEYTDNDIPVIIWTTIDLNPGYYSATWTCTNGKTVTWYANEHCMVLVGHSGEKVFVCDPTYGTLTGYDAELFKTRYNELFKQAVIIK